MYIHQTEYRVPYPEVDRLNVVHHGHYAKYYEIGRLEAMRSLGWSYKEMEDDGIGLFVAAIESKFLRPARYDDVLTIITTLPVIPGRRILFQTEILDSEQEVCNIGTTKLLFVQKSSMKVCSVPKPIIELLKPHF